MDADEQWIEVADGPTTWRFDASFLRSRWTCIWGRGCQGILDRPAPELHQGCCSVGAELTDEGEAMTVAATATAVPATRWQHRPADPTDAAELFTTTTAAEDGTVRFNTRLVDGACIFLNRPGFAGGMGCALHLAALDAGESPLDWKPSVCWQLPLRVDFVADAAAPGEREVATVRRWTRADWGEQAAMAWCCTEEPEAYVGEVAVIDSLAEELGVLVGEPVLVRLRAHPSLGARKTRKT